MSDLSQQVPLPLPQILRPWLSINIEFHIIICSHHSCRQAISPHAVNRHLRDKHQVGIEPRKQLDCFIEQWQWPYDCYSLPLPLASSAPQPILPILDGFQCIDCRYMTQSRPTIRQHCNSQHDKKRVLDSKLFHLVKLQTWFSQKRARYWVVSREHITASGSVQDEEEGSLEVEGSGSDSYDPSAVIKTEVTTWIKQEEEEARFEASTIAAETDPWLRYTGWEAELAGSQHDLVATARFTATATATEPELEPVLLSWERIFQRCLYTLTATSDYKDILKWWASPKQEAASQRPFERPEKQTTVRYSQTFVRLLCYVCRTVPDIFEDDTETGITFSEDQWQCVKDVHEGVAMAVTDNELDTRLMKLIISLVTQDTSQLFLYESPVMHYLAVRSINPQTNRFYPSFQYTPILAQMIWVIRLVILELAVSEHGWPELGIPSRTETGAVAGAVAVRIHQLRREYLCEGSFSPASSILSQLAFGQKQNRIQPSESNIYWADDRQTVFFDGKGVAMTKVRHMCQALTDELEATLNGLLFYQSVESVPLPQLVDSMGTAQRFQHKGYSFLDHPDNTCWKVSWEFLYQRMLEDGGSLVKKNASGSGSDEDQLVWAEQPCKAYLIRETQFLRQLMVVMHFTGGQPARSPELGTIKVQNSVTSSRNIFIINGRVAVVTTYDKAQKRRGKTEYIFRCFPDQLSQIITQYLIYVLPLTRVLAKTKGDYLFADDRGPWIKDQLSAAVAVATSKHLSVRLTSSSWRHVAIAIANEHLRKASRIWKQDQDENDEGMAVADDSDGEVEQSLFEHILVRQSAHGQKTADLHYAVDGAFLNRLGPDLVNVYSQASRAWHAFLQLPSHGAAVAVAAVKRAADTSLPVAKRHKLNLSPAAEGLQKILGPDAQPRSEGQRHALELVHTATATQPQTIVLGTGSGKSLLFFSVAAMVLHQTVIVVVPFTALVHDLVQRGRGHGLHCEEWQWQRSWTILPQLLIISADRVVEGDFLHFAKGLELNQQLAHVFFDECHVAVTDTSYRAKLRQLWQLRYLQCRFTCLTATLLTCLEPVFRANLLLESASLYRQSTIRPTIRYRVVDCYHRPVWDVAEPLIGGLPLPLGSRGVIYVRSYAQGDEVAEALGCPFYKATATGKDELLRQWRQGHGGWIVATGALGTGIDIPGIIYIIHLGRPYGLTSFMQQAGRGGRAGEISDSIVILPSSSSGSDGGDARFPAPQAALTSVYSVEAQDETALTEYLESTSCRRSLLAQYLDGISLATDCRATDSILCDQCFVIDRRPISEDLRSRRGSGSPVVSGADMIHSTLRRQVIQDEQLQQFHQQLHPYCIYCVLMLDERASHCHRECVEAQRNQCGVSLYQQWRQGLVLACSHQCFQCGLSQSICRGVEEERLCEYPYLMLPGMFFLSQVGQLLPICYEVGFGGEETRLWQWLNLNGEGEFGAREVNWMRVWRRVGEIYLR